MSPFFHDGNNGTKIALRNFQGVCRKDNILCIIPKIKTAKIDGRGVQKSYVLNDSAVFRLPVFYNQQLPDIASGMITMQKTPTTSNYDAFAPNTYGLLTTPNPISWIQCVVYNKN
jgi:hypothetical protein